MQMKKKITVLFAARDLSKTTMTYAMTLVYQPENFKFIIIWSLIKYVVSIFQHFREFQHNAIATIRMLMNENDNKIVLKTH